MTLEILFHDQSHPVGIKLLAPGPGVGLAINCAVGPGIGTYNIGNEIAHLCSLV